MLVVAFTAIAMILDYFFVSPPVRSVTSLVTEWVVIIFGFSLCFGAVDLVVVGATRIHKKARGWPDEIIIICSFLVTLAFGLIPPLTLNPTFKWIYAYFYVPPAGTLYGMLALYMVSASWRAFKLKNLESAAILVSAFCMVLANAPVFAVISGVFPALGSWINNVPSAAGWRAFFIGAAVGTLALGFKVIVGLEKGALGA